MRPKIIKNEREHKAALSRIDQLMEARPGTPQADELELLAALVEIYEDEAFPIDEPDPVDAIRFRMEQQGLTRRDLQRLIGTRTRVADILSRRRSLTLAMVRRLHEQLGIPAEVLIRPSRRKPAA